VHELRPGLWTWTASHPDWTSPEHGWGPVVRSYALDAGAVFVLVDPLAPPPLVEEFAAGKEAIVVLTVLDHERSAAECVERLGARVYAPHAVVAELATTATGYAAGDALPGGVEACTGFWPNEATLWLARHRALVTGDVLIAEQVREGLRPLLELPVELVLPTHGDPIVRDAHAALAAALGAN